MLCQNYLFVYTTHIYIESNVIYVRTRSLLWLPVHRVVVVIYKRAYLVLLRIENTRFSGAHWLESEQSQSFLTWKKVFLRLELFHRRPSEQTNVVSNIVYIQHTRVFPRKKRENNGLRRTEEEDSTHKKKEPKSMLSRSSSAYQPLGGGGNVVNNSSQYVIFANCSEIWGGKKKC